MFATLAFPLIDVDRMNPSGGKGGGNLTARWWIVAAFIAAGILWQVVRAVVKGY